MELTPEQQELEKLNNSTSSTKAPKAAKGGKLGKGSVGGDLGTAMQQRNASAAKLGQAQAVQDLNSMGATYTQTLAAGISQMQGTTAANFENIALSIMNGDMSVLEPDAETDFFGQMLADALNLS